MAPLPRAARLLRSAAGRLRSPPPTPARLFSSAAGTGTGVAAGREAAIIAAAVAVAGSGLGLWLKPPSLADSGETAAGGQISVAGASAGVAEARKEKRWFLFAGERPASSPFASSRRAISSLPPCLMK
jgi:hypothetical protein